MSGQASQSGLLVIRVEKSLECKLHIPIFSASQTHRIEKVRKHKKAEAEMDREADLEQSNNGIEPGNDQEPAEPAVVESTDGDDQPGSQDLDELMNALNEARTDLDKHREAMLRMQAEMDNQRKRMARESEKSRKFALERMMKDLLQVWDSLERGLEIDNESVTVEGLREGQVLTLKVLAKVTNEHGLEVIDPIGQPFNPEFHEAMTMAPSSDFDENTVMEVLQKGFRLHDRLIRPAMVVVSRGTD
jgi:molecular chaperone GrpE